jgi:hypothetical protein
VKDFLRQYWPSIAWALIIAGAAILIINIGIGYTDDFSDPAKEDIPTVTVDVPYDKMPAQLCYNSRGCPTTTP